MPNGIQCRGYILFGRKLQFEINDTLIISNGHFFDNIVVWSVNYVLAYDILVCSNSGAVAARKHSTVHWVIHANDAL